MELEVKRDCFIYRISERLSIPVAGEPWYVDVIVRSLQKDKTDLFLVRRRGEGTMFSE